MSNNESTTSQLRKSFHHGRFDHALFVWVSVAILTAGAGLYFIGLFDFVESQAGSFGCANVETPMFSANPVSAGIQIGIFDRVTNCSNHRKNYTVTISAVSSCGVTYSISSARIAFKAGQSLLTSVSWPIPADMCSGAAIVSESAYDGKTLISSGSATLTIE